MFIPLHVFLCNKDGDQREFVFFICFRNTFEETALVKPELVKPDMRETGLVKPDMSSGFSIPERGQLN